MIYHHLLKASYTSAGWHSTNRRALHIYRTTYCPASRRLCILRASRQINHEAISVLYEQNTFRFLVGKRAISPCGLLCAEALDCIQYVDISVDTKMFLNFDFAFKKRGQFDKQPRGLGSEKVTRKRCRVTLNFAQFTFRPPKSMVYGMKTLANFEAVIVDAMLLSDWTYNGWRFLPSSWLSSCAFEELLEPELGAVVFGKHDGHDCLIFHPMEGRTASGKSLLPGEEIDAETDGKEQ